ncbi:MAG: hypothetical protein ACUVX8_18420 [Candidatus Zipacnadales bacterium]
MQDLWAMIWTVIWFASLGIFTILSVIVIFLGGRDLAGLLRTLRDRHQKQEEISSPLPPPLEP